MSKNFDPRNIVFCLLLILVNQHSVLGTPSQTKLGPPKKQPSVKRDKVLENSQRLKEPVDLPDLPMFNGETKFIGGYQTPMHNGISTCQMNFSAKAEPQAVKDFYKSALESKPWKLLYAGGSSITARHTDGHMCTINVNQAKLPNIRSRYYIAYRQIEKQR